MIKLHNLGFPRIGPKRELKFSLEAFWQNDMAAEQLQENARDIYLNNLQVQAQLDYQPVADFSLYDHVLDHSVMFGNVPERFIQPNDSYLQRYFRIARGRAPEDSEQNSTAAAEMTKWFDTNYHYIVPELDQSTTFELSDKPILQKIRDARANGFEAKPVIIGPISYLRLAKSKDDVEPLDLLQTLLPCYKQLLENIARTGVEWVQIDEPALVTELPQQWQQAFHYAYQELATSRVKLLLTTYFGKLQDNLTLACQLPVAGLHIDAVSARDEIPAILEKLPDNKVLSLGIIDGRNIWKTDLNATLDWLQPIADNLHDRLWLAPACSLLHVPVSLQSETRLDPEICQWLAFAEEKIQELVTLGQALNKGREHVAEKLEENQRALVSRRSSTRVTQVEVQQALAQITEKDLSRKSGYKTRRISHQNQLNLPLFPTTTIGSFPQTAEIRQLRRQFKQQQIDLDSYQTEIKKVIAECIARQEELGLDVLVHGEAERNDMVEYFGELLEGFAFTQFGWVQSYGSRCVKPPVIYGDVHRPAAMTVDWITYAQSLTTKPLKGMLTGPVTILNWSFVRDDQPREMTCRQIALAIRAEVLDLEKAGIHLIQIDEAALREGLPLRASEHQAYLQWAIDCFRLSANGVTDSTQIHTHMCYSDFNDIIESIAKLDADVISIETSRSDMELLDAFNHFDYPNELGPGVYDIHSPNVPDVESITALLNRATEKLPKEKLWVNPDCGLKTRHWEEVIPALQNMVRAARKLRRETLNQSH